MVSEDLNILNSIWKLWWVSWPENLHLKIDVCPTNDLKRHQNMLVCIYWHLIKLTTEIQENIAEVITEIVTSPVCLKSRLFKLDLI